jgi:dienelactone hydrolase
LGVKKIAGVGYCFGGKVSYMPRQLQGSFVRASVPDKAHSISMSAAS